MDSGIKSLRKECGICAHGKSKDCRGAPSQPDPPTNEQPDPPTNEHK